MVRRQQIFQFAYEDLIIPFTPYIEDRGIDLYDIFFPGEIDTMRWGGDVWGYPLPPAGATTSRYWYRKDNLEEAGFDPEKPPETWQELEEAGKATTVLEGGALTKRGFSASHFQAWLYCNNGAYASEDAKTLLFNSPEGVETLEWLVNYTDEVNGGIEADSDFNASLRGGAQAADFAFYEGRETFVFYNSSLFNHFKTFSPELWDDTSRWGIALRPYNGGNSKATHHGMTGLPGNSGYVIPKGLPREMQDAAYLWAEYFGFHQEGGCFFLFEQQRPTSVRECNANPAYYDANPYWATVLKAMETDVMVPIAPVESQITALLSEAIEEAYYGVKTPQEALDWAAEQGQEVLDGFWSGG
jgi:ABC-type glycerol-3-phosphate transport system substrate-binding protein